MKATPPSPTVGRLALRSRRDARWRSPLCACLCSLLLLALASPVLADERDILTQVDDTRAKLDAWIEMERSIAEEKRDWALSKEILDERILLVSDQIELVREEITLVEGETTDSDRALEVMVQKNEALKEASATLGERVVVLEERVRVLVKRLPSPLKDKLQPLTQRLPESDEEAKLPMSQRFLTVIGILNEINKFNREIITTSELRTFEDGTSAQVTVVYVGIGQGYYVDQSGKLAGVGTATEDSWIWKPVNESAPQIAQAIAIMNNEAPAAYVNLPVEPE